MWDFIQQYFITPIFTGEGYNVFNTSVYALLFIAGLYLVRWLLRRWKVKVDARFFDALLPFIVLAGLLRALQDYWPEKSWLFITPGIYLLMAALVVAALLATNKSIKKLEWAGRIGVATAAVLVVAAAAASRFNILWLAAIVGSAVALTWLLSLVFKDLLRTKQDKAVVFAQCLDGCASALAIAFLGYGEQHVVSGAITGASPFLFPLLKVALVIAALKLIGREESEWNWLLKIAIVVLGLGPGTRDVTRVFIGV